MATERTVSVTLAVERAASWTKRILFTRSTFSKWLALGFCAFLANLGRGGGGVGNYNPSFWHGDGFPEFRHAAEWFTSHMELILAIGAVIVLLCIALGILLTWLSSRGEFMFLDGVSRDVAAVTEPWHRFKSRGNNLFLFRLVLGLGIFAVLVIMAVVSWEVAKPNLSGWRFDGNPIVALLLGLMIIVPVSLAGLVVNLLLHDFVVPVMYRRDIDAIDALRVFTAEILPGRLGEIILFYLLKLALAIGAGVVVLLGTCLTCCIAGLPYISSVVFLPVHVFFRCYSLAFLDQADESWRFLVVTAPPPPPTLPTSPGGWSAPGDQGSPPIVG